MIHYIITDILVLKLTFIDRSIMITRSKIVDLHLPSSMMALRNSDKPFNYLVDDLAGYRRPSRKNI
jgi:hypothetical protein